MVRLDHPDDEEEIYHSRGSEVSPARPLLTGDVLSAIELPGSDCTQAMIVAHPCTMRRGVELADRLVCVPVIEYQRLQPSQWTDGFFSVFPLSGLESGKHCAGRLDEPTTLDSANVKAATRLACLEHRGILLLQQRLIFSMTRCVVELATLRESMQSVLTEADLQEDWCDTLCEPDDALALDAAVEAFDQFLGAEGLRDSLGDPTRHSQVIKRVSKEIEDRRE